MKNKTYKCCICNTQFTDLFYNWYSYYKERKYHKCTACESELVASYDFERIGKLDKATNVLLTFAVVAGSVATYFLSWKSAGVFLFGLPATLGGLTHAIYWSTLSEIKSKEVQATRLRSTLND